MPQAIVAVAAAAAKVFTVKVIVGVAIAAAATALAIDASLRGVRGLNSSLKTDNDLRRESLIRTAIAPRNIVLGKTLVGGVLAYQNVSGESNKDMWMVVAHTGHRVNDIKDMWLYDDYVGSSNINFNNPGVLGGKYYINGQAYLAAYHRLGTSDQTVIPALQAEFPDDFTAEHRGRGNSVTAIKLTLDEESEKAYEAGEPRTIKSLIEGTPEVYDPRLDTSPGANPTNPVYQAYTTNPILLAAWYATQSKVGAGIPHAKINWQVIADEADYCDVLVPSSVPNDSQPRFTCNGLLTTQDAHRDNIDAILSACNGRRSVRSGLINFRCGRFGVGGNLLNNGSFITNVDDWSVGVNGAVQGIATTPGSTYTVRVTTRDTPSASNSYQLAKSDNADGSSPTDTTVVETGHDKGLYLTFTATAATSYICLNSTAAPASSIEWVSGFARVIDTSGNAAAFQSAEAYLVSDLTIDHTWLRGDLALQGSTPKSKRFNSARGFYVNRDENYTKVQSLPVTNTAFVSRDNGETLWESFELPMTDNEDEAQRIVHRRIQQTDQQKVMRVPCNYRALKCAVHGYVRVNIDEWGFVNKIFRITSWRLNGIDDGVDLLLKEDDAQGYADPDQNDYSTRDASGGVTVATPEVPEPNNPILTAKEGGNLIEVTAPRVADYWDRLQFFGGAANDFNSASLLSEQRATALFHKLDAGETRYYWVRSRKGNEFSAPVATTPDHVSAANTLAIALQNANAAIQAASDLSNTKVTTYFQNDPPTLNLVDGDLWVDGDANNALYRYRESGSTWVLIQDSQTALTAANLAQSTADGKIVTYRQDDPPVPEGVGDLWVDTNDLNKTYRWSGATWISIQDGLTIQAYADAQSALTQAAQAVSDAGGALAAVDGKIGTFWVDNPPTAEAVGDLWFDTNDGNKPYRWSGSTWVLVRDDGVAQALLDASGAQATADGKLDVYYANSDSPPGSAKVGDLWSQLDTGVVLRWDGAAWNETIATVGAPPGTQVNGVPVDFITSPPENYIPDPTFQHESTYWAYDRGSFKFGRGQLIPQYLMRYPDGASQPETQGAVFVRSKYWVELDSDTNNFVLTFRLLLQNYASGFIQPQVRWYAADKTTLITTEILDTIDVDVGNQVLTYTTSAAKPGAKYAQVWFQFSTLNLAAVSTAAIRLTDVGFLFTGVTELPGIRPQGGTANVPVVATTDPTADDGKDGDTWTNEDTGFQFQKDGDDWKQISTIGAPDGSPIGEQNTADVVSTKPDQGNLVVDHNFSKSRSKGDDYYWSDR